MSHANAFQRERVAESGDRLRRLVQYYRAHQRRGPFPEVHCNAPCASAVVESSGTRRPCFIQPAVGNLRRKTLRALLDYEMVRSAADWIWLVTEVQAMRVLASGKDAISGVLN